MKKLFITFLICLLLFGCFGDIPEEELKDDKGSKEEATKPIPQEPVVVSVISEPPGSKTAAYGTGIVVDKKNGLILTARHGVYGGDVLNYKNENLFKNILVTYKSRKKVMSGYVVHISLNYDLAVIKVDHQFPSQAVFVSSDFLKIKDKVDFQGFADGQYGVYNGHIANVKADYLHLDMNVVEGMSGGPIVSPDKGIVGIVLLKQKIGGDALKSEIVNEYLSKALPQAKTIRKKNYSLCLKKIILNESNTRYVREDKPEFYFFVSVNGSKIIETEKFTITERKIQLDNCDNNIFKVTLLPGDKIELKLFENTTANKLKGIVSSVVDVKKTAFIEKIFEALPQKGLPDLTSEIIADDNSIFLSSSE